MFEIRLPVINYDLYNSDYHDAIQKAVEFKKETADLYTSVEDMRRNSIYDMILNIQPEMEFYLRVRHKVLLNNYGQRKGSKVRNGTFEEQLAGLLVEESVKWYLRDHLDSKDHETKGFDGGYDMSINGVKIDIKTTGRETMLNKDYSHNIMVSQVEGEQYEAELYLLGSYNRRLNIVTISGFITKNQIRKHATIRRYGQKVNNQTTNFGASQDFYDLRDKSIKLRTNNLYDVIKYTEIFSSDIDHKQIKSFDRILLNQTNDMALDILTKDKSKVISSSSINYYFRDIVR